MKSLTDIRNKRFPIEKIHLLIVMAMTLPFFTMANDIKKGTAAVKVTVTADSIDMNGINVWIDTAPIFSGFMESETQRLRHTSTNIFEGEIPMELEEDIVGILIENPSGQSGSLLKLNQQAPKEIAVTLSGDGSIKAIDDKDPEAYTFKEWTNIHQGLFNFFVSHEYGVPDSLYSSWQKVRAYELDTLLPQNLDLAFASREIPDKARGWMKNIILTRFASLEIIPYTAAAKGMNHLDVEEPPMEAYTFLDSIDCPETLLTKSPYCGLKPFLYTLLRFPEGGFDKIGETPVGQWKEKAAAKLSRAMAQPAPLLLDLLSAMSYVAQIDVDLKNLTPRQIENVKTGYANDLGKIILSKDSLLTQRRQNNLIDLSADPAFDLKKFIDEKYAGRPVIIDIWNTWCAPCLDAINQTEAIKKDLLHPDSPIAFLYLSDTSSPFNEWEPKALSIGGDQVRMSKDHGERLFEAYGLDAFPSYIVFDKDHNLVSARTGYPGSDAYIDWLFTLSAQ